MSARTVAEAEAEVTMAGVFGRPPKEWATRLLAESSGPVSDQVVCEAELDVQRARIFGREPSAETVQTLVRAGQVVEGRIGREVEREVLIEDFRACGLTEADAMRAQAGLERGSYRSFAEAARSASMFSNGGRVSRLNGRLAEMAAKHDRPAGARLEERRAPRVGGGRRIVERASGSVAGDLLNVVLITAGQGSSGFYPASVLEQAVTDNVFHRGLHLYVDHPTLAEHQDRPERSVRDLAGTLATDATYRDGGLYAQASILPTVREMLSDSLLPHIGLSIRGEAEMDGTTVARIVRADSVDFVTHAGRGGRVLTP